MLGEALGAITALQQEALAKIAAVIGEEAFAWLDAPVGRVGGTDSPIPFAPTLERSWSAEGRVLPALRALLAF